MQFIPFCWGGGAGRPQEPLMGMEILANRALDATVRIKEIVGSLKGFARTEEDQQTPVDLVGVIESAITMTNHVTKDKARVVRDFPPGLPTILGNGGRLQQLFINLLVNAAQAIIGNPSKPVSPSDSGRRRSVSGWNSRTRGKGLHLPSSRGFLTPFSPPSLWVKAPAWACPSATKFTGGTQSPEFRGFLTSKGLPCLDKPFGVDELRAHLS